jgi:hypothetical protein
LCLPAAGLREVLRSKTPSMPAFAQLKACGSKICEKKCAKYLQK